MSSSNANKTLFFTNRAKQVVVEREIDLSWVTETAKTPDWVAPEPGSPEVERRFRIVP